MARTIHSRYNIAIPITSFGSDVDLAAQTGAPRGGQYPGQLEVFNDEATAQNIVLEGIDGTSRTYQIPADTIRIFYDVAFAKVIATGTQTIAEVVAYYEQRQVGVI